VSGWTKRKNGRCRNQKEVEMQVLLEEIDLLEGFKEAA